MLSVGIVSAADYGDIQDEIDSGSTRINLGSAVYTPETVDSINVNKDNIVIKGQSASSKAILDGSGSNSRIMTIRANNVTLENLIFRNVDVNLFGGAISVNGVNLTIINCDFTNNRAMVGAIVLNDNANNALIRGCTFTNNVAAYSNSSGGGGGGSIDSHASNGEIINCTFINNQAITGGGALYFIFGTNNLVSECTFKDNNAPIGGAIWTGTTGTSLTLTSSSFTNNKATNNGGAIYTTNTMTITNINFDGNSAKNYGGAIYNSGTLSVLSSSFSNNQASSRLTVSVPSFVNCSNNAVIKATFFGGNNIKDAIYSNKNIQFNGATVSPNDKIPNQNIVLTVNGKTFNNKTNNQGIATFNINTKGFAIKKHNGVVNFSATGSYVSSSANFVLNVVTKKVISSVLKNIKTYKTKLKYQARIPVYTKQKVKYDITYWKSSGGNSISPYKNIKGTKTVSVFKKYLWKNISKGSVTYKWYMQRYYKVYYKKAINYTKTWINGNYKGLTKKQVKYTTNSKNKMVKGKTKDFSMYVLPSTDCESNNPTIKALAKKLIKGKKTDTQKANAILKYVQKKIRYPEPAYGNTRKGALGTYTSKIGNCVDSTHLTVALLRAANIPAKYEAKYVNSNIGGHCWPLVYLKVGKKYKWVAGEATEYSFVAFGKSSFVKKWQRYKANAENYINSYKYSKKYIKDNSLKQKDKWVPITEYQYINGNWLTYYVTNGNADRTYATIPKTANKVQVTNNGIKVNG
jgi:predicted outer membrane repeat protein